MKRIQKNLKTSVEKSITIGFMVSILFATRLIAQDSSSVIGNIRDKKSNEPVPFASVCIAKPAASGKAIPLAGTISKEDGSFQIASVQKGSYILQVSSVGYKTASKSLDITNEIITDAGMILLTDTAFFLKEATVTAERLKGKSIDNKTVFFINKKMQAASGSAIDLLKHIPRLQVDLKQNIALNGRQDILILIDGRERDKSTISQLSPSQIDRIEVLDNPPSDYEGNVSGVINVVTRKNQQRGFSGKVFSEIPTSESEIYIFPMYNLMYSLKNVNIYTSYNGEINYENIDETTVREINTNSATTSISSVQKVRQKNLSHKFHYGLDYHITPQDVVNIYGFYNPYSYEQDGKAITRISGKSNQSWLMNREEYDKNHSLFNSLYYKHIFKDSGAELTMDINHTNSKSSNRTVYQNMETSDSESYTNTEHPGLQATSLKIDLQTPAGSRISLFTGGKARFQHIYDEKSTGFKGDETILAWYGKVRMTQPKNDYVIGLRLENSSTSIRAMPDYGNTCLLPFISWQHEINDKQNTTFTYRRSIDRPTVFNLNPYRYVDDPFSIRLGNPLLTPEMRDQLSFEHTLQFQRNFVATRLFYEKITDAINNLTVLTDTNTFVSQAHNMGTIHQAGVQVTGSSRTGILSLMPNIRLYHQSTTGNNLTKEHEVADRRKLVFESNVSAILSFKNNWALSGIFQYATPKINIQEKVFSDALYFISLDKTFKNNLKLGMVSALPLAKNFVYQGSEINDKNFSSRYTGNLKLSTIPLMFRLSYQFSAGENRERLQRDKEEVIKRKKPGL